MLSYLHCGRSKLLLTLKFLLEQGWRINNNYLLCFRGINFSFGPLTNSLSFMEKWFFDNNNHISYMFLTYMVGMLMLGLVLLMQALGIVSLRCILLVLQCFLFMLEMVLHFGFGKIIGLGTLLLLNFFHNFINDLFCIMLQFHLLYPVISSFITVHIIHFLGIFFFQET